MKAARPRRNKDYIPHNSSPDFKTGADYQDYDQSTPSPELINFVGQRSFKGKQQL